MSSYPPSSPAQPPTLRQRLAGLRGPAVPPRPLDARALAALAANPGCGRRALLDGAGVDKTALASALGSPASFGQSQFAIVRGNSFEAKVKGDGGAELLRLVHEHLGAGSEPPGPGARVPDLTAAGPEGRAARTALALREATAAGRDAGAWTLLDHPMLALEVAGSPAYLEPDAVVVHPDGRWTVVEIKSFPMIDGSADAAKVGAAARQAAVYVLALEKTAEKLDGAEVGHTVLLVCPKDFSNLPTASSVDIRRERSVTRRQLERLTRVEELAAALPEGLSFDPARTAEELTEAVSAVDAAYAPECLAACELAFHCRDRSRAADEVTALGRSVRGELGALTTVEQALAAAVGGGCAEDPTATALHRAARLRTEALDLAAARPRPEGVSCPC
uniref:Secreted protein n=1 Tax=Streptomyces sp. NBC_00049 TaxID=2903617 RepID=A0AAU2JNK8_9ACTN